MIKFVNQENKLNVAEVRYWKKLFNANLMIGTEIEQMFDNSRVSVSDVSRMLSPLKPGGSPERFRSPVEEIKSDGSLTNGAEIITPGRKVYGFMEQYGMFQSIYELLESEEPIISERCGWHNHIVLQDSGAVALETEAIPRIIFDNFMLLLQHYYPALAYMSSTMPHDNCYTRFSYFNKTEALKWYKVSDDLDRVRSNFSDRYNAINIRPMNFYENKIKNFHVEFRFPDGTLFPAQMAGLNILFKAIVLKSIELCKYGTIQFTEDTNQLYAFKNEGGTEEEIDDYGDIFLDEFDEDDRMSSRVNEETMTGIVKLSKEFVNLLETEIIAIDKLALPVIKTLSIAPVSVLFKQKSTDDIRKINEILEEIVDVNYKRADDQIMPLMEIIDLGMIRNTETKEVWFDKASELVSFKEPINNLIEKIKDVYDLNFDKSLGFYFK